jgi:hypothetical protein
LHRYAIKVSVDIDEEEAARNEWPAAEKMSDSDVENDVLQETSDKQQEEARVILRMIPGRGAASRSLIHIWTPSTWTNNFIELLP